MSWSRPAPRVRQWEGGPITPRDTVKCANRLSAQPVQPILKSEPVRDEAYRRLVAALPCINCRIEGFSQAAHGPSLGRGIKCSDLEIFPLCSVGGKGCHQAYDEYRLYGRAERDAAGAMWADRTRSELGRT